MDLNEFATQLKSPFSGKLKISVCTNNASSASIRLILIIKLSDNLESTKAEKASGYEDKPCSQFADTGNMF